MINDKTVILSEFSDVLERCGLTRDKPYNIIDQGFFSKTINFNIYKNLVIIPFSKSFIFSLTDDL